MCLCLCACVRAYVCVHCVSIDVCLCTCTCVYTGVCTCVYTCVCTCVCPVSQLSSRDHVEAAVLVVVMMWRRKYVCVCGAGRGGGRIVKNSGNLAQNLNKMLGAASGKKGDLPDSRATDRSPAIVTETCQKRSRWALRSPRGRRCSSTSASSTRLPVPTMQTVERGKGEAERGERREETGDGRREGGVKLVNLRCGVCLFR